MRNFEEYLFVDFTRPAIVPKPTQFVVVFEIVVKRFVGIPETQDFRANIKSKTIRVRDKKWAFQGILFKCVMRGPTDAYC